MLTNSELNEAIRTAQGACCIDVTHVTALRAEQLRRATAKDEPITFVVRDVIIAANAVCSWSESLKDDFKVGLRSDVARLAAALERLP